MELTKICPVSHGPIDAIVIPCPDNNIGLVVTCRMASDDGKCPLGERYICMFNLGDERE